MSGFSNTLVFLTSVLLVGDTKTEPSAKPFVPNPTIMTYFDELLSSAGPVIERETVREHLEPMVELAKGDKGEALAQVLYQTSLGFRSKKYDNDMTVVRILVAHPLWEEMKKDEQFELVARFLVNHDDIVSQQAAWYCAEWYEDDCCEKIPKNTDMKYVDGVCFEAFTARLAGRLDSPGPVTTAIVDYLIQRSPTASLEFLLPLGDTPPEMQKPWLAVNQFVETHYTESRKSSGGRTREEFCTSTTVTEEEVSRLASLYDGASWWQRIYLAEVIRQNPFLSSPKLVQSLRESKEPHVLLSLDAAKLEETQGKIPGYSRWEIQAKAEKVKALAVPK